METTGGQHTVLIDDWFLSAGVCTNASTCPCMVIREVSIKMTNIGKIISIAVVAIVLLFMAWRFNPWVLLPIKSVPHELTLVNYGGPYMNQIILRHYINGLHINDYVLELKIELWYQKPQTYMLPQLGEGMVEVKVDLKDGIIHDNNRTITVNYAQASYLYEKGLLIYTTDDSNSKITIGDFVYRDQYIYFITGKERQSCIEKAGSTEWSIITDAPQPKKFTREGMGYSSLYYGWKENVWEMRNGQEDI